ncbi:tripartite tricarboxylate transporter substrate binding protein [Pigmentiphaga soli]|uniref:Tripartite tricarboxylate transporter substrate binding protein n=1 Tax=Pigmentiphaga soli TaxID=1007095 RepID=A0ABP8H5M0_9BURK
MAKKTIARALGLALLLNAGLAAAQENITRIVVAFPPGGPQDFVARVISEQLGKELHEKVIVDNRPGANGAIAASAVARAEPDGRTLWLISVGAVSINPFLYDNLAYDMARDFAPVSLVTNNAELLVVPPDDPARNAAEFVANAKKAGGTVPMASTGIGSVPHLALEQLRVTTGMNILHVPYKGAAPAITDLLGRQVRAMFADTAGLINYVKSGRLKAIGIAAPRRTDALPDVPTLTEQGLPSVDSNNWFGLFVAAKTPPATIARINAAVRRTLQTPEISEKLSAAGSEPAPSTPEELAAIVRNDTAKWGKLIHDAKIKVD